MDLRSPQTHTLDLLPCVSYLPDEAETLRHTVVPIVNHVCQRAGMPELTRDVYQIPETKGQREINRIDDRATGSVIYNDNNLKVAIIVEIMRNRQS